jgi:hypothetical protein
MELNVAVYNIAKYPRLFTYICEKDGKICEVAALLMWSGEMKCGDW